MSSFHPALRLAFTLTLLLLCGSALAAEPSPARVQEIAAMLPPKPVGLGRPITDRAAWTRLAQHPGMRAIPAAAEKLMQQPIPPQPEELYMDFANTGNRDRFQGVAFARRGRIATFAIAECLENKGRFLKPLEETIAALCAERSWVLPAHDRSLKAFKGELMVTDLASTTLSWELATANWILGEKLSPATRTLIQENVARRTFTPFRNMLAGRQPEEFWLKTKNNWNAVCLAGVTGSALTLLDSPEERAYFAAAAENLITNFLSGFEPDGYCSEGLGYWNYGFGCFVQLSETLRQSTGGKLDLFSKPEALNPAQFGLRAQIINRIYPPIADCSPQTQPTPLLMHYICQRLQINAPQWKNLNTVSAGGGLHVSMLYSFLPATLPPVTGQSIPSELGLRTWFKDGGVLICRPTPGTDDFAACLKGGHNAEHHNHNDVGSFSVVRGKTMVICDPGGEVYTKRTFSSQRYESKVLNSFGHSVPVVAGKLQKSGSNAKAVIKKAAFTDQQDTLQLDIRSPYPVPELQKLDRTFVFQRGAAPSLRVQDQVEFANPASFETALITWSKWKKLSDHELLLGEGKEAVRVQVETAGRAFEWIIDVITEDVRTRELPQRIAIRLQEPLAKAQVSFTISPAPQPPAAALKR